MALATQVEENLKDAESSLRAALSYAARTEKPVIVSMIADMIHRIEGVVVSEAMIDRMENRKSGGNNPFNSLFGE
jgi:uncharacterized phage protein gp47/JayE